MLLRLLPGALCLVAAFGLPAPPAMAEAPALSTRYTVGLIGLPVGRASFVTRIDGGSYTVDGTLTSTGLADIVSTVKGTSRVSGRIAADRLVAGTYDLDYTSNRKHFRSSIAFRSGRVTSVTAEPEAPASKDFIPVTQNQLRSVVDPLTGLMIKAGRSSDGLCARTLPFFDGWSRLDMRFAPAGRQPFSTDGFEGDAVVCTARVEPISGYKPTSKGVQFIAKQTMEIWFAPVGKTGIFAPVYAKVPTEIGPLTFRAAVFAKP
ncbi:DUF3108 domain-containing protein [Aureimonas leprariae]|uniref:DUF3108 domain-containing protein n=1 Tax=Plantimonas leprariae TaxID=2615207 RepID=A0A7V7TYB9_9HYPH|nr:DUF3108 domain-containing protein [Aureimonas leprariae]KAB0677045.1 DUF3108 domain-containing protein [Aureimonas leprariae]